MCDNVKQYYIPEFIKRGLVFPNQFNENPMPKRLMACVLFADLRGFSNWCLTAKHEEISEVFDVISGCVVQMLIDYHYDYWKLIGDGIMLVWDINNNTDAVDNAIGAAFELHKKYWYYWKESKTTVPKGLGIAICGGEVIKYASSTFFQSVIVTDYLGPIVNQTSRFQSLAQSGQVLVNKFIKDNSKHDWYSFADMSSHYNLQIESQKGILETEKQIYLIKHKYFDSNWDKFCK